MGASNPARNEHSKAIKFECLVSPDSEERAKVLKYGSMEEPNEAATAGRLGQTCWRTMRKAVLSPQRVLSPQGDVLVVEGLM